MEKKHEMTKEEFLKLKAEGISNLYPEFRGDNEYISSEKVKFITEHKGFNWPYWLQFSNEEHDQLNLLNEYGYKSKLYDIIQEYEKNKIIKRNNIKEQ
jgi:hypothetical protein